MEVTQPQTKVTTLEVKFHPEIKHFLTEVKLTHEQDRYETELSLDYEVTLDGDDLVLSLQTNAPSLKLSSNLALQRQPQRYSLVSTTYMGKRKYVLDSRVSMPANNVECNLKLVYPGRKIVLKSDSRLHDGQIQHTTRASWERGKTVVVTLDGHVSMTGSDLLLSPHLVIESVLRHCGRPAQGSHKRQ